MKTTKTMTETEAWRYLAKVTRGPYRRSILGGDRAFYVVKLSHTDVRSTAYGLCYAIDLLRRYKMIDAVTSDAMHFRRQVELDPEKREDGYYWSCTPSGHRARSRACLRAAKSARARGK